MTEPTDAEIVAVMRDGYNCRYNDEADHIDFARAALAKWGAQPVPAGYALVPVEPSAEMVDSAQEAYMPFGDMQLAIQLAIAAAPQPAAREPLSPERVKAMVLENGYGDADTTDRERAAFIDGLRHGEDAHGIKGGQHGTE